MANQRIYKYSPWGQVDYQRTIIEGIISVGTPSHGGIKLSAKRQAQMPDYMRSDDGWYEEDCDWALVYVVFGVEIRRYYEAHPEDENAEYELRNLRSAPESVKNWRPEAYEKFFGEIIPIGESYIRSH